MFYPFELSRLKAQIILAFVMIGVWHLVQGQIATNDFYVAQEGSAFTVPAPGVLANDMGSNLTATLVNSPANGTLALNVDGSFTYTPTNNFTGMDGFTYQTAGSSGSGLATVDIMVVAPGELFYDNFARAEQQRLGLSLGASIEHQRSLAGSGHLGHHQRPADRLQSCE